MTVAPGSTEAHEQRLDEVLAEYLKAAQEGRAPTRTALLDRHPDLADALTEFFADQDRVEQLAAPLRAVVPVRPPVGTGMTLGDYELLGEIAQGGMGVVYRARQKSLDRTVALKVLRAGPLVSPEEWKRFQAEALAVASLDHPHIIPVYEVAEQEGLPFFSMKLLEGGSLAARSEKFRNAPQAAAELLATVADAIQYAHERGVLHRDLKPANILLDAQGKPHVTDFGLARRFSRGSEVSDARLTVTGAILGTPSYMAPEQAAGAGNEVTTAADVYGLGAVLYELLTGRPPFKGADVLDTLYRLREEEPAAPRSLNSAVPRDLETICLKCLAKAPAQRYGSARDLAADLRRFLAGEPISARPAGLAERLWRGCRRRPVVTGLVLALLLTALAAFVLVTWKWREALASEAAKEHERQRAEDSRERAQRILNQFCGELSDERLAGIPSFQPARKQLLETGLGYYREFLAERADDPGMQADLAATHFRIGAITSAIGSATDALDAFEQARAIREELVRLHPDDRQARIDLARTWIRIGATQGRTSRTADALESFTRARDLFEQLSREQPEDEQVVEELAAAWQNVGIVHREHGRFESARTCLEESVRLLEELVARRPESADFACTLGSARAVLGGLYLAAGRREDGRRCYERSQADLQRAVAARPTLVRYQFALARNCLRLGSCQCAEGKYDESLATLKSGQEPLERLARNHPDTPEFLLELASNLRQAGHAHREKGRGKEALACYERARQYQEQLVQLDGALTSYRSGLASCHFDIAVLHARAGRVAEAIASGERARDEWRKLVQASPENVTSRHSLGLTLNNLAINLSRLARNVESLRAVAEAIEHNRKAFAAAPLPRHRQALSNSYFIQAKIQRAVGLSAEAVAATLARRDLWPDNPTELYRVACDLAAAAEVKRKRKPSSPAEQARREEYRARAVQTLGEAVRAGFDDVKRLETDADWAALRHREDFQAILGQVSGGARVATPDASRPSSSAGKQ
jgi:tetratricopeptide (TPR) repeat protein